MREFEPWGIVFTVLGLAVALVTIVIDLEDRQSDRVFRAWQVVREFEIRNLELDGFSIVGAGGSSMREAVELLNREFDGFMCVPGVGWISEALTGNDRRECLIPKKKREWLTGLKGPFADLMEAKLEGARLAEAKLRGAYLAGADLAGADLSDADLSDADLVDAYLNWAYLSDADLSGTDLAGALLLSAYLTGADLSGADLVDAVLMSANLTGADLTDAAIEQYQLDSACGDTSPRNLPTTLIWNSPPCE